MTNPNDSQSPLDRFIEELRDELSAAPSDEAARHHVIKAVQATGWSTAAPPRTAGRIRWRKRLAFGSVFSGALAKFVGVGVALAATTAGVGATGVLPDEVQDPIAQVAQVIGIDLPDSSDDLGELDDDPDSPTGLVGDDDLEDDLNDDLDDDDDLDSDDDDPDDDLEDDDDTDVDDDLDDDDDTDDDDLEDDDDDDDDDADDTDDDDDDDDEDDDDDR